MGYTIRKLEAADLPDALRLVWETFLVFEAPDYSDKGVREFQSYIELSAVTEKMTQSELLLWGCFDGEQIIGVIAVRQPCHISLLFVDQRVHRKGIARALFHTALAHYMAKGHTAMTVNSSPYAAGIYRRLGFMDTNAEQTVNGIRFVPMRYTC